MTIAGLVILTEVPEQLAYKRGVAGPNQDVIGRAGASPPSRDRVSGYRKCFDVLLFHRHISRTQIP